MLCLRLVYPITDEVSQQVCALKVLAISVGKGLDSLIYIYEEYNSVSLVVVSAFVYLLTYLQIQYI